MSTAPARVKGLHGWDGPVEIRLPGEVKWYQDAKTLAALIQDSAPVGSGPNAGTLRRDLALKNAGYQRLPKPRKGWRLEVYNSYADIQDQGGTIKERRPRGYVAVGADMETIEGDRAGKALRWGSPGSYVFAKRAGPFTLPGQHYLARGLARWMKARGHDGMQIGWKDAEEAA